MPNRNNLNLTLTRKCQWCDKVQVITVNESDYRHWLNGKHIQDAFPYLTADDREMLKSLTCQACFDGM